MRGTQLSWYSPFLSPEPTGGGGAPPPRKKGEEDGGDDDDAGSDAAARRFINAGGDKGGAELRQWANDLWEDNKKLRERGRTRRKEIADLKEQVPPEGAVVLSGDDVKAWQDVQALATQLQVKVTELPARIKKSEESTAELAKLRVKDVAREAAEELGYDAEVLLDRLERDELYLEIATTTEKVDGQDVQTKVPKVRKAADASASLQELAAYTEANWTKYLPALLKGDASPQGRQAPARHDTPPRAPAPVTRSGESRSQPAASIDQLAAAARATGMYPTF